MRFSVRKVAPLLFFSGACALVYQVAWLRDLRLIFGASTAASAAVLGVFMAGLGIGGIVLGKRADRSPNPLAYYANLELLVALTSALTPLLVGVSRAAYLALGGQSTLGAVGATVARLVLGGLVLLVPTFLMGGTMPAAARAVTSDEDSGRHGVSALYGANTLGAVVGALATNFVMLEVFGTKLTLWMVCLLNALVGLVGRMLARNPDEEDPVKAPVVRVEKEAESASPAAEDESSSSDGPDGKPAADPSETTSTEAEAESSKPGKEAPEPKEKPAWFPIAAAGIVGFAFLLMELVWYRMLSPLLGGSSYTFGLILAVALFGIGVGGLLHSALRTPPTLARFAVTCGLEALFISLPFAAGDRVALFAVALRSLRVLGFGGSVTSWAIVCMVVIFPAAVVSGAQFPLLIGLFGKGRKNVGDQLGMAYLANTIGAIVGSLSGGFGLLPILTAPGCWKLVVLLLVASACVAVFLSARDETGGGRFRAMAFATSVVSAIALFASEGPTAAWRHTPIGAGRADALISAPSSNAIEGWRRDSKLKVVWEADGRESSVALAGELGYSFVVNGKVDGNVFADAPTQVMSGLLGALVHPNPKRAMVIGLGTGSTSGWLGKVPSIERVDVSELEPAIVRVARDCGPINEHVLDNPKVHVSLGDAREFLVTTKERYDVVFSEPSNPYRAGISSLYTQDYYRAVARALTDDGVFVQWMQSYEVEAPAFHTVMATLRSVFGNVTLWESMPGDFLMIARREDPGPLDLERIRQRLSEEPFRTPSRYVWGGNSVEVFLSHFIATDELAKALVPMAPVNRDDQNFLEFSYARTVGAGTSLSAEASRLSKNLGWYRPRVTGRVDWDRVDDHWRLYRITRQEGAPNWRFENPTPARVALHKAYMGIGTNAKSTEVAAAWNAAQITEPTYLERLAVARTLARGKMDPAAFADFVRDLEPGAAAALRGQQAFQRGDRDTALRELLASFAIAHESPWVAVPVLERALELALQVSNAKPESSTALYEALKTPFLLNSLDARRRQILMRLSMAIQAPVCAEVFRAYGEGVPWDGEYLLARRDCAKRWAPDMSSRAEADLAKYQAAEPLPVGGR